MDLTVEKFKIGGVPIDVADKQSRENIESILQAINSLQGSINVIENKIADLPAIDEAMQKDIASLKSEVNDLQSKVNALESSSGSLQSSVSSLQSSVSSLQSSVSSLQNSVNSLATTVSNLDSTTAKNTDFNTQYSAITGTLIDGYVCNRKGNISLELGGKSLKSTLSANTWTNILTLPSGYRPIAQIYRTVTFAGVYSVILEINTSGTVKAYTTSTLNSGVTCYDGVEFI